MDAGGLLGHEQRRADLAVGRALGEQRQHLALARGQPERIAAPRLRRPVGRRRRRAAAAATVEPRRARASPSSSSTSQRDAERAARRQRLAARLRRRGAVAAPRRSASASRQRARSPPGTAARARPTPAAAARHSAGVVAPAGARQLGRAVSRQACSTGPPSWPRRAAAGGGSARARARRARSRRLAQVAGALRDVGLDPQPDGGHPGDPHHVVGAQLEAVERLLRPRRAPREVAAGGGAARRAASRTAPIHCGSAAPRDERLDLLQAARAARSSSPSPSASSASRAAEDQQHADRACDGGGPRCARASVPVAGLEGQLGDRQPHPVVAAAEPARRLRPGPPGASPAPRACAREAEQVGEVGSRRTRARRCRRARGRSRSRGAAAPPRPRPRRARSGPSRACSAPRPRRDRSPAATAAASAASPSVDRIAAAAAQEQGAGQPGEQQRAVGRLVVLGQHRQRPLRRLDASRAAVERPLRCARAAPSSGA